MAIIADKSYGEDRHPASDCPTETIESTVVSSVTPIVSKNGRQGDRKTIGKHQNKIRNT